MIYELRTYDMVPELFEEYIGRADTLLLPIIREKIGFNLIGFWRSIEEGGGDVPQGEMRPIPAQVVWMIAWNSMEERDAKWAELRADEEWLRVIDSKYYQRTAYKFVSPTAYSPLQ